MAGAWRQAHPKILMRTAAALAILWLAICGATPAFAHASLATSEPRDGTVLTSAPKQVELHFNEKVTPGAVHLIDATGRLRRDGFGRVERRETPFRADGRGGELIDANGANGVRDGRDCYRGFRSCAG